MSTPGEQGWSAVDLNGTGISMYPAPTEKMTNTVATILNNARDGWNAANGRIEDLEGKLGEGPMGKPVIEQYNPAVKQIREIIADTLEQLTKISAAGTKAVPTYVNADLQAGYEFGF